MAPQSNNRRWGWRGAPADILPASGELDDGQLLLVVLLECRLGGFEQCGLVGREGFDICRTESLVVEGRDIRGDWAPATTSAS